ncbi:glycosyltransferase family 2 protein [Cryobacterium sp. TMS1-20-1]|uniref:glycosyltransferase family 2 protein n=1 Tax=Cryobacterium sp. TMS1-20-1 TaxID=1259223 RepID=UPI00106B87A2|nr:glycosyltransferase family 2 protein [Cryobacterium sp. TMS1-20-1]TFC74532.1 glycosyltransferase family 2 protein [Cryobacterium sp. TMS1-20-1]
MTSIAKVGVVTVTYNSGRVLDDFLVSLKAQVGVDVHLYAVDNASSDDTLAKLSRYSAENAVTTIANSGNEGVASGNNQGTVAALADGCDWVLLLNNDTVFGPDVLASLVRSAEKNQLNILSPLIEATEPAGSIWYLSGVISPYKGMWAKHLRMGEPLVGPYPDVMPVDYASTCALLIRPSVFESVGLMDPVYFVYGDDVDFCIRATRAGFQYAVAGDVKILHKASSITGAFTDPFAVRWVTRNWAVVARRHCSPVQRVSGSVYMAAWTLARFAARRENFTVLKGRLRAFREGWTLNLSSVPPRLDNPNIDRGVIPNRVR